MSTAITTTRPVDLGQLAAKLGVTSLTMADDGTERIITCHDDTVTQAELEAAGCAPVPAPPPPNAEALLQQQINELTDLILFGF